MQDFDFANAIRLVAISAVPALLGIILHEIAHGWMARRCGDHTAESLGRLTLNPIPHIDPMGLAVFGLTSLTGSFVFGWAKPVPVDPRNFGQPRRDMMLVALAGPAANFLLAVAFGAGLICLLQLLPYASHKDQAWYIFTLSSLQAGIIINFGLGWLNLLPVPPLDGSKILAYFLSPQLAARYLEISRYGFIILILLLATGVLGKILGPLVRWSALALYSLLGLA
ncbi:MAG: site-2 protease family protein [Desulfovibrio sp.]|nr:site-2 protease family protein [Desulfovibrio sp.]